MIGKLRVEGYRGFKSYTMDGLARVNLIVGKNNSGKTALLEALAFLASGGAPVELASIAARRGEWSDSADDSDEVPSLSHFFFGHELGEGSTFRIEADRGYSSVGVSIASLAPSERDLTMERAARRASLRLRTHLKDGRADGEDGGFPVWAAHIEGAGSTQESVAGPIVISSRGAMLTAYPPSRRWLLDKGSGNAGYVFVTTASMSDHRLAQLWKKAELEARTDAAVAAIRLIDQDVNRIVAVPGGYREAEWFVATHHRKFPIPIGSYGDGVRRLLGLSLAMVGSADGMFLVDEIDTGLHYSAMSDVWKMVIGTAEASNIQVFATTHSWDCIAGLSELLQASPELQTLVAIHKIDRNLPHSVVLDGEATARITKQHIDPR